jgi:predicted transcriptional regulator YdeE
LEDWIRNADDENGGKITMMFKGIGRTFSTENDQQYETIGAFWDELAAKYGRANLQGLGYGWTNLSIEYVIGLIDGEIDGADRTVELPDTGWVTVRGKTADLGKIYEKIYQEGRLSNEIERFTDSGDYEIMYRRLTILDK